MNIDIRNKKTNFCGLIYGEHYIAGDEISLLLAASVFNLKKWMRLHFFALFVKGFSLILKHIQRMQMISFRLSVLKRI